MIVLDASLALDIVRKTEDAAAMRELMLQGEKTISCELMRAEVANACRRLVRLNRLTPEIAEALCEEAIGLVDQFYPMEDLLPEALRESIRLQHSTYDLFYFVLARRTGATLFTLDRKLMRLCEEHGVNCVHERDV